MIPEEKAKQIYNKYYMILFEFGMEEINISIVAKRAALIAIGELINHDGSSEYLQQVRGEIVCLG